MLSSLRAEPEGAELLISTWRARSGAQTRLEEMVCDEFAFTDEAARYFPATESGGVISRLAAMTNCV